MIVHDYMMEKGECSMATYAGKINNQGTQKVEALFKGNAPKKGSVKHGNDLRVKK